MTSWLTAAALQSFPVPAEVEIEHFHDACGHPSNRIAETDDGSRVRHESGDEEEVDLAAGNITQQHNYHRSDGIATAAECACQRMVNAVEQDKIYDQADK